MRQPYDAGLVVIFYDTLKRIHDAWLLTPRDDLGGACPREVALEWHGHLTWDLQDRCEHWSRLDECPRRLAKSSHAYQHGGFGTHELVEYYELVRHLLWCCWDQLTELAGSPKVEHRPGLLAAGDFLASEIPRLESSREVWLDSPDRELHGRTPRSVINRERTGCPKACPATMRWLTPTAPAAR